MRLIKLFEQYIQEEVEASAPVTPIGKKELIEVLINHIRRIEKNNDWAAMDVAQVIYNDCAFFMNKDGVFSDKTKYGDTVTQPAAQTAPVAIPRPGMEDAMDNSIAPIAPTLSAEADPQFEQFVSEETEAEDASMTKPKTVLSPQILLSNESDEFNREICTTYENVPSSFDRQGDISDREVDWIVDYFDDYQADDTNSTNTLIQWIKGGGAFRLDPTTSNKPLKYRVYNDDGIHYPAVEQLRVKYNLDETFETLGGETEIDMPEIRDLLEECYQYWISSIDNSKFNPTGDALIPKGDMSGFAKS
jgi:hypothetical protein